jgi:hypothetical protein
VAAAAMVVAAATDAKRPDPVEPKRRSLIGKACGARYTVIVFPVSGSIPS